MAPVMNPIDYYVPVVNRGITIRASAIACMVISWAAVSLRLWSRWKLMNSLGVDDLFVSIAAAWALFGAITLTNETPNGLGLHKETIITTNPDGSLNYDTYSQYFFWFYLTNVSYAGATTSIKLSLLFQYMRLFPRNIHPRMFRLLVAIIVTVATWGTTYLLLMIFSCDPIDKSWHVLKEGKCIMFSDFRPGRAYAAYASHTSSNMFLDTVILITPIPLLLKTHVSKRAKLGLAGLFTIGTLVVVTASLRLWFVVKNRAGTYPTIDPPWYAPPIVLMSVLEVNLAILTASMPIFWPYLASIRLSGIKVMQEVTVRSEPRKNPYHSSSNASSSRRSHRRPSTAPYLRHLDDDQDDHDSRISLAKNGSAVAIVSETPSPPLRSDSGASDKRLTRDWWAEAASDGFDWGDGVRIGGKPGARPGSGGSKRKDSAAASTTTPAAPSAGRTSGQFQRDHHYTSSLPYDGDRHRMYYGDPTVAELVVGDIFGGEPAAAAAAANPTAGGQSTRRGQQEGVVGSYEERMTGHQAAAWFEPDAVPLEDLGSRNGAGGSERERVRVRERERERARGRSRSDLRRKR